LLLVLLGSKVPPKTEMRSFVAFFFVLLACQCAALSCFSGKAYTLDPKNSQVGVPSSGLGLPKPFDCSMSESQIASTGAVRAHGGAKKSLRWYIGEVSNRTSSDPIVAFFQSGKLRWCRTDFESSADTVVGYGLLYDAPSLYVVFSTRGYNLGTGGNDFRRFTTAGWQTNYGNVLAGSRKFDVGSAKASVLLKLDPQTGDVLAATYLTSKRIFGTTADLIVTKLDHTRQTRNTDEAIIVTARASGAPLRPDGTRMRCTTPGPHEYTLVLDSDLKNVLRASAPNCS